MDCKYLRRTTLPPSHRLILLRFCSPSLAAVTSSRRELRQRLNPPSRTAPQTSSCDTSQALARVVGLALKQHPGSDAVACGLGQRAQPLFPGRGAWLQNYRGDRVERVDRRKKLSFQRAHASGKHCSRYSIRDPAIVVSGQIGEMPRPLHYRLPCFSCKLQKPDLGVGVLNFFESPKKEASAGRVSASIDPSVSPAR